MAVGRLSNNCWTNVYQALDKCLQAGGQRTVREAIPKIGGGNLNPRILIGIIIH